MIKSKPKLSDVLYLAAEYVLEPSSPTGSRYSCFALDSVSSLLGIKEVNGKSPARIFFEKLFEVKKLEASRYYSRFGLFGNPLDLSSQESRVQALLLAAEYARSEGL